MADLVAIISILYVSTALVQLWLIFWAKKMALKNAPRLLDAGAFLVGGVFSFALLWFYVSSVNEPQFARPLTQWLLSLPLSLQIPLNLFPMLLPWVVALLPKPSWKALRGNIVAFTKFGLLPLLVFVYIVAFCWGISLVLKSNSL